MKPGLGRNGLAFWVAVLGQFGFAAQALAAGDAVTQEQFKAWTDWAKKSISILDQREKKVESEVSTGGGAKGAPSGGGEVNLLEATAPAAAAPTEAGKAPHFETYFDLNLINQPGTADSLAFDNYHSLVFLDITPTPDITFSFNLLGPQTFPIYYELDYQSSKRLILRAGKIWIPFDDLSQQSPHNIFGGRVGLQQLMPTATGNGGNLFLPSLWTELGVGARYMLIESSALQVQTDMTITNGFTDGGQDPLNGGEGPQFNEYTPGPTQQGQASSGSHRNKAIDLRAHGLFMNRFGLGISYYTSQWNKDGDPNAGGGHLFLNMIGIDAQAKLLGLELRGGLASMHVMYPEGTATRGGTYAEAALPFKQRWKLMMRGGTLQLDNRVTLPTDITVVGGTLLYNPGNVQFSIEHSRNVKNPNVAVGFSSFTDLRMIMLF